MTPRVIVVTGASRGIGRATAVSLGGRGTQLFLAARDGIALEDVAGEVRQRGGDAYPVVCDVTSEAQVQQLLAVSSAATGQIDALVNAAGGAIIAPFAELSLAQWETTLRTGLTGVFLCCKYAAPAMPRGATIVNIASVAARQAFPGWAAYSATKAGLVAFSNVIREELRPRGVRVVTLLPAATDTPLWDALPGEWNRTNMLAAADVARTIAWAIEQPAEVVIEELTVGHVIGRL